MIIFWVLVFHIISIFLNLKITSWFETGLYAALADVKFISSSDLSKVLPPKYLGPQGVPPCKYLGPQGCVPPCWLSAFLTIYGYKLVFKSIFPLYDNKQHNKQENFLSIWFGVIFFKTYFIFYLLDVFNCRMTPKNIM